MFSVVIPIYNHSRYLEKAVESCLSSSLVKEILLADDGSIDDSAAIASRLAEAYPNRIRNLTDCVPGNIGAHNRLNQLCAAVSQPWIAILNSDDFFIPHRFELIAHLLRHKNYDLITGAMLIVDDIDTVIGTKRGILQPEYACPPAASFDGPLNSAELLLLLCSQNIVATTSNIVFRKTLFQEIGGFADLRYAHDWDFVLRATMKGRCLWTPNMLTGYRSHASNTIKEKSPHMDGEICRLFYQFLADFPDLETIPAVRCFLETNQHISPYVSSPALAPVVQQYKASPIRYEIPRNLSHRVLLNAYLGIYFFSYDFVVISSELDELPIVCQPTREMTLMQRSGMEIPPGKPLRGRFMRFSSNKTAPSVKLEISAFPGWNAVAAESNDLVFENCPSTPGTLEPAAHAHLVELLQLEDKRPTCLVLPMFMAVGGVERNTIEMMRELQTDYRFVVATTEPHSKSKGSLHYQLDDLDIPTFDLAEVGKREHHLSLLAVIAQIVSPDVVWICNGSPWLLENALQLRRLFAGIPIIDQQVYDTNYGWINDYDHKGVQSFDHFIAINSRIREKLSKVLRIPLHRLSLIYSAVNAKHIGTSRVLESEIENIRNILELPIDRGRIFAFIGRLTQQKRPLHFLHLALESARSGSHDMFVLVGDGDMREKCDQYISDHKLDNVICIRYSSNTAQLLSVMDGLIITSEYEGLPIVMIEALAVGCPVFASDVGDIGIVLNEFKSGATFSSGIKMNVLNDAFAEWLCRRSDYKKIAIECMDNFLKRFSSASNAELYRRCFDSCRKEYNSRLLAFSRPDGAPSTSNMSFN